jgi:hypothetical protein
MRSINKDFRSKASFAANVSTTSVMHIIVFSLKNRGGLDLEFFNKGKLE